MTDTPILHLLKTSLAQPIATRRRPLPVTGVQYRKANLLKRTDAQFTSTDWNRHIFRHVTNNHYTIQPKNKGINHVDPY